MWFKKKVKAKLDEKLQLPKDLWVKCENLWICPKCSFHFRINCRNYITLLLDNATLQEHDGKLEACDPLEFPEYKKKLKSAIEKTNMNEGVVYGQATIDSIPVVFAAMDFRFMGGSMGSVVGEKIARAIRLASQEEIPLIILSASGGARMQEGIFSLMQMAKTSAELAILAQKRIPYISILTHPTTAGVMASYASLGDIIIAEPGALLGFTGARVAEQTIGEKFPPGLQRSESLLSHGMVDLIVSRKELRNAIATILSIVTKHGQTSTR
jgi:acetyl-CoA carboxylase carboxyl transferase subunit beta